MLSPYFLLRVAYAMELDSTHVFSRAFLSSSRPLLALRQQPDGVGIGTSFFSLVITDRVLPSAGDRLPTFSGTAVAISFTRSSRYGTGSHRGFSRVLLSSSHPCVRHFTTGLLASVLTGRGVIGHFDLAHRWYAPRNHRVPPACGTDRHRRLRTLL